MIVKSFRLIPIFIVITSVQQPVALTQNYSDGDEDVLNVKLQLLDSKMELLDTKIQIWENSPGGVMDQFDELRHETGFLRNDVDDIYTRLNRIDSIIRKNNKTLEKLYDDNKLKFLQSKPNKYEHISKSAISLNPVRLFEGTIQISYERRINRKMSLEFSGMTTYATREGLSSYFIKNQEFNYFDARSNVYKPYNGEHISGFGLIAEYKNYLLAELNKRQAAPVGLYAASRVMMRRFFLSGTKHVNVDDELIEKEITQCLNVYGAGVFLGIKISIIKALAIDLFAGGIMRLSQYDADSHFTRYKSPGQIDYSGVLPTAGIKIGILK